jgi:hypothetical protein
MTDAEIIKRLKKENGDLKLEVARLWHTLKLETASTSKHIKHIYQQIGILDKREHAEDVAFTEHIANIYDIILPIEDKIFPNAKETRKQLTSIVGRKRLGAGKDLDKRKS